MSGFLQTLSLAAQIKKTELVLPISKIQAIVSPLTVGDDFALKSSVLSPANLDTELTKLLHKHTEFIRSTEELEDDPKKIKNYRPSYEEFISSICHIDKSMLLWGIYKATYDTLSERDFTCINCTHEFKKEITLDELIQEDSLTFFEELEPFYEYKKLINIPFNAEYELEFLSRLPSIKIFNNMLSRVSIGKLQENLEKTGALFDMVQMIALFTESLALVHKVSGDRSEAKTSQEILMGLEQHVPLPVKEKFMKDYEELWGKYAIKFYTNVECPNCKNLEKFDVDLDRDFFRKIISN